MIFESWENKLSNILKEGTTEESITEFRYRDMVNFYFKTYKRIPGVNSCRVSIRKESEMNGMIRPTERWAISMIFCDSANNPIRRPASEDGYGKIFYADAFDRRFSNFMNGRSNAIYTPSAQELNSMKKKSIIDVILEKIKSLGFLNSDTITVSYVKSYREVQGAKIVLASVEKLIEKQPDINIFGDDVADTCIIAEYDEATDNIVKINMGKPDERIQALLDANNGIVVIED